MERREDRWRQRLRMHVHVAMEKKTMNGVGDFFVKHLKIYMLQTLDGQGY